MKKIIIASIAGAGAAAVLGFAAPAQAETPAGACSYFSTNQSDAAVGAARGICGLPDLAGTFGDIRANLANNFSPSNAATNLHDNFSPGNAATKLQDNFDPSNAAQNLQKNLSGDIE